MNAAPSQPVINQQTYDQAARTFTLAWDASSDSDGIQGYQVYLNGQLVTTLPASATSYTFEDLVIGTAYSAEVRAVDALGAVSTAASTTFGGNTSESTPLGAPNTGLRNLTQGVGFRIVAVIVLGVVSALVVLTIAKRRANH